MDMHDDEQRSHSDLNLTPVEALEQQAGLQDETRDRQDEGGGMPVVNRVLLHTPGQPYPMPVPTDPTGDEAGTAAEQGLSQAEVEAQRKSGE